MNAFIHALKHPRVRELAWICFSEPVLSDLSTLARKVTAARFELHENRQNALLALDHDPEPLLRHLTENCRSKRLGLVFETYWHFFLQHDAETELIAHNLPVRDDGKTLGEFDVLYHCHRRNRAVHLELALKYFMATPEPLQAGSPMSQWLGPNSRDRLDIKWQRMRDHQLALPRKPAAQAVLQELGIPQFEQEAAVKGWLFHHPKRTPEPAPINPDHCRGLWQTHAEFSEQENASDWRYLAKPDWLDSFENAVALEEKHRALTVQRPIMVINEQQERRMIAPDTWPETVLNRP
ncbi:hypothetical protein FHR99_000117 [Litorivivens lipolytica]|uniref:DUF1853 family protein n=1 Tax=Litorivivens lipolytica TaxID=1524264 RepID=A0A7W4W1S6_9GAMM|nr:DUF1853 family protein [Litorivivens lipolytica]MBB3045881.1 hypothetical protein [Litorivivens lipolytica]